LVLPKERGPVNQALLKKKNRAVIKTGGKPHAVAETIRKTQKKRPGGKGRITLGGGLRHDYAMKQILSKNSRGKKCGDSPILSIKEKEKAQV